MKKKTIILDSFKKTHEHLKSLKCPKCGKKMRRLMRKQHLVGCMEYELFLCDREYPLWDFDHAKKSNCRVLIINYPHKSAGKDNRIIRL